MRNNKQTKRRPRLLWIFICVSLVFALLWGAVAVVNRLLHYGENAVVSDPEPTPEPEPLPEPEPDPHEGWPKNPYDPEEFYQEDGFTFYSGEQASTVGVDVSSHQGQIDWQAVKAAGVEFAMIRVGYRGYTKGEIQLDEYFQANMEGAAAAGIQLGVYFFSQAISVEEALEEASFVLNQIDGYDLTYPVVFDWEDIEAEARTDNMDMITLTSCADAFCQAVERAGYTGGVYFNQRFGYQELNLLSLEKYTLWLAEYNPTPTFAYHFDMWQYSCTGKVDGIETDVDLNLSFGEK